MYSWRRAKCPFCGSLERHREIAQYFIDNKELLDWDKKILHFAPDKPLYNLFKDKEYIRGDINLQKYNNEIEYIDITDIKYQDNYFDIVVASHILEHVIDDIKAMSGLYRVLKQWGIWIVPVPINYKLEKTFEDNTVTTDEERKKVFGQRDHIRIYWQDYIQRLESVWFEVSKYKDLHIIKK